MQCYRVDSAKDTQESNTGVRLWNKLGRNFFLASLVRKKTGELGLNNNNNDNKKYFFKQTYNLQRFMIGKIQIMTKYPSNWHVQRCYFFFSCFNTGYFVNLTQGYVQFLTDNNKTIITITLSHYHHLQSFHIYKTFIKLLYVY